MVGAWRFFLHPELSLGPSDSVLDILIAPGRDLQRFRSACPVITDLFPTSMCSLSPNSTVKYWTSALSIQDRHLFNPRVSQRLFPNNPLAPDDSPLEHQDLDSS